MSTVWTPGQSPLYPCQSLKHLTSNHCSDSGAVGYHVSFAFNLATAVAPSAPGLPPAISVPWIDYRRLFFLRFRFLLLLSRQRVAASIPSLHRPQFSGSLLSVPFYSFKLLLMLKTWIKQVLLAKSWQWKVESQLFQIKKKKGKDLGYQVVSSLFYIA